MTSVDPFRGVMGALKRRLIRLTQQRCCVKERVVELHSILRTCVGMLLHILYTHVHYIV